MSLHFDFENGTVVGAGNFRARLMTLRTTALLLGPFTDFRACGQMLVLASPKTFAVRLLPTWPRLGRSGRRRRLRPSRGRGLGFAAEEASFPFANFRLQHLDLEFEFSFALDGWLMLGLPVVSLLVPSDAFEPQFELEATKDLKGEEQQGREKAAPPLPGEERGFAIAAVALDQDGFRGNERPRLA